MPATEQTWRNQRLMHIVFGVTGLVLLLSTVWMLYADYNRGWKPVQRQSQQIDNWFTNARITERRTGEFVAKRAELDATLKAVQSEAPPAELVEQFVANLDDTAAAADAATIQASLAALQQDPTPEHRQQLLDDMQAAMKKLRLREDDLARQRKFERANLDVAKSSFDLGVGGSLPDDELDTLEADVLTVEKRVDALTADYEKAKTQRLQVEADYTAIVQPETVAKKAVDDLSSELSQLEKTYKTQTDPSRNLLTLPILDAFGSPIKPKQIWLPSLPQNNNFKDVARFDRCTTCHMGIKKTATGSAILPGYEEEHRLTLSLATPATPPAEEPAPEATDAEGHKRDLKQMAFDRQQRELAEMYGLAFADRGLLGENDFTVQAVWPYKAGAQAGLKAGDVIEFIGDTKVTSADIATRALLETANWGQPLTLKVRRGLPQPFSSHPRLDLFLGSLSPHTTEKFGCTICHQGQGSATEFKWASHTPNTLVQRDKWKSDQGWFDNHHWIFPMYPERFVESTCLKCHHDVVDLEASERFPEPPAPKVVAGYNVIRQYGCFGCHEINGYNGPNKRIGPDLRVEPNYAPAAQQLLADPGLPAEARDWAHSILEDQDRVEPRHLLIEFVEADARRAVPSASDPPVLSAASHAMVSPLGDVESPGSCEEPGPSLRFVGSKSDAAFLSDWIANPTNFRPNTKMPRFFGQWDHLAVEESQEVAESTGKPSGLHDAGKFEPVEIQATVAYLLGMSQPFEYVAAPEGVNQPPSVERGKYQFETRGCLACHKHKEFPTATGVQGPDLSRVGAKLSSTPAAEKLYDWSTNGPRWLYSWVRKPNRYHARTVMPDVQLEKITKGEDISDPAADITAYLLESQEGWKPAAAPVFEESSLRELAIKHLRDKVTERQAIAYAQDGIPATRAGDFKGDESLLVGEFNDENRQARLMHYVGKRTIGKYGCAGCHDIPGFEDAKPIGTGLNNWARKDLSQLAFEQVSTYITRHGPGSEPAHGDAGHGEAHAGHGHGPDLEKLDPSTGFFMHSLLNHQRDGFLWQKLREPRSYDYMKTENKGYNERLRMPKFNFTPEQAEEVMTFVLGLVAEPPPPQYIYNPALRQKAIIEGRHVLEKFNCAGCHELQTEQWEFEFDPNYADFAADRPFPESEFDFFRTHFSPKEVADSKKLDRRGFGHAKVSARMFMTEDGKPVEDVDSDDAPVRFYALWKPTLVNGQPWLASDQLVVRNDWITAQHDPVGGDFARLLHPVALAHERETVPATKYENAWGFVPPPLVGEGRKVQPDWLYNFLLDPHPIRPAVVLRMPHFHMSANDASKLVDYFAAIDDAEFPYEYDRRTRESYLQANELTQPGRLNDGAVIATNVCVKCHLVGNYSPPGGDAAKAPDLARVHQRLRPEFTLKWVGNPARLLPYTAMNKNIFPNKPLDKKATRGEGGELIEHGTGVQQLQAVVDFVQNYDYFMKQRNQLSITAPPPDPKPGEEPPADGAAGAAAPEEENPAPGEASN